MRLWLLAVALLANPAAAQLRTIPADAKLGEIRHVQEMLGHGSLATTERYLHLTITDLKQAHHKFHPRERRQDA